MVKSTNNVSVGLRRRSHPGLMSTQLMSIDLLLFLYAFGADHILDPS